MANSNWGKALANVRSYNAFANRPVDHDESGDDEGNRALFQKRPRKKHRDSTDVEPQPELPADLPTPTPTRRDTIGSQFETHHASQAFTPPFPMSPLPQTASHSSYLSSPQSTGYSIPSNRTDISSHTSISTNYTSSQTSYSSLGAQVPLHYSQPQPYQPQSAQLQHSAYAASSPHYDNYPYEHNTSDGLGINSQPLATYSSHIVSEPVAQPNSPPAVNLLNALQTPPYQNVIGQGVSPDYNHPYSPPFSPGYHTLAEAPAPQQQQQQPNTQDLHPNSSRAWAQRATPPTAQSSPIEYCPNGHARNIFDHAQCPHCIYSPT